MGNLSRGGRAMRTIYTEGLTPFRPITQGERVPPLGVTRSGMYA
ncbi:hypothetical protein MA3A0930S_4019 [Mycobacteroides abscessus 3A-0930-S]|nr:hypothetical protein MA3A0122R_4174 [Mycobacteroides abscessus 3A-0122-R]EIV44214.1 hypothetical protein MA3A0930R_4087 [Mycobacteroides abscessus 3A-0930-R]EIV46199.1 hypothetical protein MA3A0930S_4019 [Mycobacteroides abscessus 3A-0930-S]